MGRERRTRRKRMAKVMVMERKRRRKREREIESTPSHLQHTPYSTFLDLTSEYEALREPESEISHTP